MLVKLTEVHKNNAITTGAEYTLREVFVNPEHVVMIREEARKKDENLLIFLTPTALRS
jgi:hypothetical protein